MRKNAKAQIKSYLNSAAIVVLWDKASGSRTTAKTITPEEAYSFYEENYKSLSLDLNGDTLTIYKGTTSVKAYQNIKDWEDDKKFFKIEWSEDQYSEMVDNARVDRKENQGKKPADNGGYYDSKEYLKPVIVKHLKTA